MSPTLISEILARFVGGFGADRIPGPVIARAKHLILDAVGIALASTTHEFSRRAITAIADLAGRGDAIVIGTPLGFSIAHAPIFVTDACRRRKAQPRRLWSHA